MRTALRCCVALLCATLLIVPYRLADAYSARFALVERARVVVHFSIPYQLGSPVTAQSLAAQRDAVALARSALLQHNLLTSAVLVRPYTYLPLVVLDVDTATLALLRTLPGVIDIDLDDLSYTTLAESTALIGAPAAWASGYSGAGQTIVILDTGVDTTHPFLASKVVAEGCFSNAAGTGAGVSVCPLQLPDSILAGSGVPCTINGCDHGTHIAGIAAGHSTQSVAFSGVARDARLASLQVFTQLASGCGSKPSPCIASYRSDQLAALDYVVALSTIHSIAAVNMSLGSGSTTTACDTDTRKVAIDLLWMLNIATIVSSGNDGASNALSYPACISSAISVGATRDGGVGATPVDTVATFSNSSSGLRLLAPGQTITSSVPGGGYASLDGTSMAAPHVAGAWAVIKAHSPSASVSQILNTLRTTGVPITDTRNNLSTPRIDLAKALGITRTPPSISITDTSIGEGDSGTRTAQLNVQLSFSSTDEVRVDYATINGTASGGSDFTPASGTLVFPAGTRTQTVDVAIAGDTQDEADEVFSLTLTNPQQASLGDAEGVIRIYDDDSAPTVRIVSASVAKRTTNQYSVSATLELSAVSGRNIDVFYQVQTNVGTYDGSASVVAGTLRATSTIAVALDEHAGQSSVALYLTNATDAEIDTAYSTTYLSVSPPEQPTPTVPPSGIERRVFVPLAKE